VKPVATKIPFPYAKPYDLKLERLLPDTALQDVGGSVVVPIPYIRTEFRGRAPEPIATTYVSVSLKAISTAPAARPEPMGDAFNHVVAFDEYLIEHVDVVGLIAKKLKPDKRIRVTSDVNGVGEALDQFVPFAVYKILPPAPPATIILRPVASVVSLVPL
jgi:hypothetical protein